MTQVNFVKFLVEEKKVSKYRIAKIIGVSWNTVHFWYLGIYKPNAAHLKILHNYLDTFV